MKKTAYIFFLLFAFFTSNAQILEPVKWKSKIEKKSDTEYVLVFNAIIEEEWHMYSQFSDEMGGIPLEIVFNNDKGNFTADGKAEESETEVKYSDVFMVDETFFNEKAELRQTIKVTNPDNTLVQAEVLYQVCKESCIQGDNLFEFDLKNLTAKEVKNFDEPVKEAAAATPEKKNDIDSGGSSEDKSDPLTIFFLTLLAGIGVTFTPCVFPMIPMTVSFFLKQNSSKSKGRFNAIFYGICIVVIYVLLSVPFHIFEGIDKDVFADISTNVYLNIFFFVIFVVFAISFFGAFEITMPNSLASKADNASNSGGLMGVFFMALTLIIVSFSCTGPALSFVFGSVLSSDGGAMLLSLGMLGFGLGLAMPFMVFALFPNLMGNLPKSGGWLNSVKVVFGFIELALAFKFLSNADLVRQWHFLERETFLAIWIAIFIGLALYLFGKISFPHDSPINNLSVGRGLFGVFVLAFAVYLIPGLWGAPLKLISGFPPPLTYSESPFGIGSGGGAGKGGELPPGGHPTVHGIIAFEDYEEGLAYAKEIGKPVMIDFTGRACVNCRRMEENVWSDAGVLSILKNDVVLISLYCDEDKPLPESEYFVSEYSGRKITTVGKKWSDFEIGKYNSNARPYYVLMNPADESNLNTPVGYTPDIEEYLAWLKEGVGNYKK